MNRNRFTRPLARLVLLAAVVACGLGVLHATTIDFDSFPGQPGTPAAGAHVSNQYASQGVLFSSNGQDATIFHDSNTNAEAMSLPNVLVGQNNFSSITIQFVDPTTLQPTSAHDVSLWAVSVGFLPLTVTAYDIDHNALQSFFFQHLDGPCNGLSNRDAVIFTASDIYSIDFALGTPTGCDGIGMDDLVFDLGPSSSRLGQVGNSVTSSQNHVTGVTTFSWDGVPGATAYNVYRGVIGVPFYWNHQSLECDDAQGNGDLVTEDPESPQPGRAFYYLVAGVVQGVEGSLGQMSGGAVRPNGYPCP